MSGEFALALALLGSVASAQQAAAPYTFATRYNEAGQLTGTLAPDPDGTGTLAYKATRNTYETTGLATGLLIKVESGELSSWADESVEPKNWTSFAAYLTKTISYDSYARKSAERVIGSDGFTVEALTQWSYDDWDRVRCKAVRMNKLSNFASAPSDACTLGTQGADGPDRITRYTYNNLDMVLTEERAVGTSLQQTYATNTYAGRTLTSQTDAKGNRTELRYFPATWRLYRRVYPSPNSPGSVNELDYNEYDYDANGNVTYERKRNNKTINNIFDKNDRLRFKNLSDNTYSKDIAYDYDLRGLALASCFDEDGNNQEDLGDDVCDTSGEGETNVFNGFGDLTSRKSRMAGYARTLSYEFDKESNRTRVTHPDGAYFTYGRDGLNRVCRLDESAGPKACDDTTNPSAMVKITYRPSGGRLDLIRPNAVLTTINVDNALRLGSFTQDFVGITNDLTNTFTYNAARQITKLTQSNPIYTFNQLASRTGTYQSNGLNQISSIAGQSLSYDAAGNLTNDAAGMTFTFDMENHLVTTGGSKASTLVYDVLGRLSRFTADGITTQFLYDGDMLVGEFVGNTATRRYVHGDQVDEPLVQYNSGSIGASYRRYLHADHQGSIIAHSDSAGAMPVRNAYDPYGIPSTLNPTNDGRFGYTGQAWLKEIGLNYYKARMYSPKLGRFLQTDPIFYKDDMNLYAYVGNNPTNNLDPLGLQISPVNDNWEQLDHDPFLRFLNRGRPDPRMLEDSADSKNELPKPKLQITTLPGPGNKDGTTPMDPITITVFRGMFRGQWIGFKATTGNRLTLVDKSLLKSTDPGNVLAGVRVCPASEVPEGAEGDYYDLILVHQGTGNVATFVPMEGFTVKPIDPNNMSPVPLQ
jgi:RHS repeat-associated protein